MFGLGVLGSLGAVPGNSGPSYDPAATAYFARIPAQTSARYALLNTVFVGLRAAGLLSLMDCLWLMAAADSTTARANLISSSFTLTPVAAPTFTVDRGYTGDGASAYLSTGFNPATAGGKFGLNSAHLSVYDRTTRAAGGQVQAGTFATTVAQIVVYNSDGTIRGDLNAGASATGPANTASTGHYITSRTAAATRSVYKNGVDLLDVSSTATAIPNGEIFILARSSSGAPNAPTSDQLAQGSIGAGLSVAQAAAFYSTIQAYMTGVGAQV